MSRARARAWRRVVFLFALLTIAYWMLPLDNTCRLAMRRLFHTPRQHTFSRAQLLAKPVPYPVNLAKDVALIIKSGFGTKDRVPGTLQLLDEAPGGNTIFGSILLTGDFATLPGKHYRVNGKDLPMYDVVGLTIDQAVYGGKPIVESKRNPTKIGNYTALQDALAHGNEELALSLSHQFGWELDALKVRHNGIRTIVLALVHLLTASVHLQFAARVPDVPRQKVVHSCRRRHLPYATCPPPVSGTVPP